MSLIIYLSDLFLASSKREGLPVAVMEAMATGLPIIATNNRGHRELIDDGNNGFLVPDNDPTYFAKKIEDIISSKAIQKNFRMNSLNVINKYSEENVNIQMKNIYSEVISHSL